MSHPDTDLIWQGHKAFNARDLDGLADVFAEDVAWHVDGRAANAGLYEGRASLIEDFFTPLREAPLRLETHDVLADDQYLVGISTVFVDLPEGTRAFRLVELCTTRDGRITERRGLLEDQQGFDELMSALVG